MIFISYSWKDAVTARNLATYLSERGNRVWIDYWNLNLDRPLTEQISLAIQKSDLLLLVDSCHARESEWVKLERRLALRWRKPIRVVCDSSDPQSVLIMANPSVQRWELLKNDTSSGEELKIG